MVTTGCSQIKMFVLFIIVRFVAYTENSVIYVDNYSNNKECKFYSD